MANVLFIFCMGMTHIVDPQSFTKGKHFPVNNCHPLIRHKYRNSDFEITIQEINLYDKI